MKVVILETPYAGEIATHEDYCVAAMRDCLFKGEAPFASHMLYAFSNVLDDDLPLERELGMVAGFAWGRKAEKTVVYTDLGISPGMAEGIEQAVKCSRDIEYRQLTSWRKHKPSMNMVAMVVTKEFDTPLHVLRSRNTYTAIVKARHAAMALCHKYNGAGPAKIGRFFHKDHSTVSHALSQFDRWNKCQDFSRAIRRCEKALNIAEVPNVV
tara:strand:- start:1033 stop:1665 length:633 start_codon:yes stop_codon:yes gene_type:complete